MSYNISHRIVLPDGTERIVYEKGRVELDENGQAIKMMGTVQDITHRYKREKELELQSKILNLVTDSIIVHNLDGSMIFANESAYKTREYTKDEFMNLKIQDLDYHDDKVGQEVYKENIQKIKQQLEDKQQAIFEVSHKIKNGSIIPIEVTSKIVNENYHSYIISIARDISDRKAMHKDLEASEKQYRSLVENSQIGIFKSNINGEITYLNDTLMNIMGYNEDDDISTLNILKGYKNPKQRAKYMRELLEKDKVDAIELDVLSKDNEEKCILVSAHIEDDVISGIVMDITESKKAVEEIKKLSKAIEEIDDIVMITDRSGLLIFVNDAFVSHTGYSRKESIGRTPAILKSGRHNNEYYKELWHKISYGEVFRGLVTNRKKDGELYYEEKTITPIHNDAGEITSFVSTGKDITQRIEMQKRLEMEVIHDGLTGLFNRRYYDEIIEKELMRAKRDGLLFTFVMLDIDFFKLYNDTYGHQKGDEALKAISDVLKEKLSRGGDYCFRLGGEEFGFFFIGQTLEESLEYTKSICKEIEKLGIEHSKSKVSRFVTASFGLTNVDMGTTIIDEHAIYVSSDKALYRAKQNGRNRVEIFEGNDVEFF